MEQGSAGAMIESEATYSLGGALPESKAEDGGLEGETKGGEGREVGSGEGATGGGHEPEARPEINSGQTGAEPRSSLDTAPNAASVSITRSHES